MIFDCARGKLAVRFNFNPSLRETTLLLEEHRRRTVDDFQISNLTRREAEILFWISEGKSDDAIALLCNISVRTVQKHVEHTFAKLGAENRTTAVAVALEKIL